MWEKQLGTVHLNTSREIICGYLSQHDGTSIDEAGSGCEPTQGNHRESRLCHPLFTTKVFQIESHLSV